MLDEFCVDARETFGDELSLKMLKIAINSYLTGIYAHRVLPVPECIEKQIKGLTWEAALEDTGSSPDLRFHHIRIHFFDDSGRDNILDIEEDDDLIFIVAD